MTYLRILQNTHINKFIEATPNDFTIRKRKTGASKASYELDNTKFKTKVELTTTDNLSEITSLENQLKEKKLLPAQKRALKKQIDELKNQTLDYCINKLAHTRIIDVFNLLQVEIANNLYEKNMTLEEAKQKEWIFSLSIEHVQKMLNVEYWAANQYLEGLADLLKIITLTATENVRNGHPDFIDINVTIQREKKKGVFYFYFHPAFIALMSWGTRRPLLNNFDYDAKNCIYMGKLRNKLETIFYTNELNSGNYQRLKIKNLLPIFYKADISKNPKKTFIEPLKKHLAEMGKTGEFVFYFTGERGKKLEDNYRNYLDLDADGHLKSEQESLEIEEIDNYRSRVKINELLENVYLNYTFQERPKMQITKKTAQKRRRAREKTAKNRTE